MRVLVTGGAGFIGSRVVDRCLKERFDVDVVDDLSNGHLKFLPNSIIDNNQLKIASFDSSTVLDDVRQKKYDTVIHLAAIPRVSYSVEQPLLSHNTNVTATLKLMDACRKNINRFVFASSSSIYGGADVLPTPTTTSADPKSPYALQKLIIENYLSMYYRHYGLDSVSLRFFNVFGPNQLGDSPYATAVSSWLTAIFSGKKMRSDGDGSQTRDMCYVDNVADACVKAATTRSELQAIPLNVACGERNSNRQILEYLMKKFPRAEYYDSPWRPGDVMHTHADISLTQEKIGYVPLVKFWDGLDKTISWYQDNWSTISELMQSTI